MTVALDSIASLSADLRRYESRIMATEETLAKLKEIYRRIAEVELPKAMGAAKVNEFQMNDGRRIRIDIDAQAGIPRACLSETFEWLHQSRRALGISCQSASVADRSISAHQNGGRVDEVDRLRLGRDTETAA
jgi:hypothetical protein